MGHADPDFGDFGDDDIRPRDGGHRRRPVDRQRPQYIQFVPREHEGHAQQGGQPHPRAHRRVRLGHRACRRRSDRRGDPRGAGQKGRLRNHHYTLYQPETLRVIGRDRSDQRRDDVRRAEHRSALQAGNGAAGQLVRLRAGQEDRAA